MEVLKNFKDLRELGVRNIELYSIANEPILAFLSIYTHFFHTIRHVYRSEWPAREAKPRFGAALVHSLIITCISWHLTTWGVLHQRHSHGYYTRTFCPLLLLLSNPAWPDRARVPNQCVGMTVILENWIVCSDSLESWNCRSCVCCPFILDSYENQFSVENGIHKSVFGEMPLRFELNPAWRELASEFFLQPYEWLFFIVNCEPCLACLKQTKFFVTFLLFYTW